MQGIPLKRVTVIVRLAQSGTSSQIMGITAARGVGMTRIL